MRKFMMAALGGTAAGILLTTQIAGPLIAQENIRNSTVYEQLDLFGDVFERIDVAVFLEDGVGLGAGSRVGGDRGAALQWIGVCVFGQSQTAEEGPAPQKRGLGGDLGLGDAPARRGDDPGAARVFHHSRYGGEGHGSPRGGRAKPAATPCPLQFLKRWRRKQHPAGR